MSEATTTGWRDAARLYLEKMFGYANHLGLYGEELGLSGETLGNYPQAFTHLGLISAAFNLNLNLEGSLLRRGPEPIGADAATAGALTRGHGP